MARYIGIDTHLESCTVAVMGPSGRRICQEVLETNARVLRKYIRQIAVPRLICIEEGMLSEWLYEVLEPLCDKLVVVLPDKRQGSKNDVKDAWGLADSLRRDTIKRPIFKAPGKFTQLRSAVRTYEQVISDLVRVKNRLKAVYSSRGVRCKGSEIYQLGKRETWLVQLPKAQQRRAELLTDEHDYLTKVATNAKTWLLSEASVCKEVVRLATAPGIAYIRAAQIVATVIAPHRFRTARQFRRYCGLGIVTHSSSDWRRNKDGQWEKKKTEQTRGLNRDCNMRMKNVFKGAASTIVRMKGSPLERSYYKLLDNGTKPTLARLTIARRLAGIVLAMWKNQVDYDPSKHPVENE